MTDFELWVERAVRSIPRGRIATPGQIAESIGEPKAARAVGNAVLKVSQADSTFPWWRVVNADGQIVERVSGDIADAVQRLRREGIKVTDDGRVEN
jgi:methylated-DNA-protein-cysteine methyltransferase-like protein